MTLEVVKRREQLAPESGVEFRPMAPISGAGFWSVCQGPNGGKIEHAFKKDTSQQLSHVTSKRTGKIRKLEQKPMNKVRPKKQNPRDQSAASEKKPSLRRICEISFSHAI